jgi:hypothetical protein
VGRLKEKSLKIFRLFDDTLFPLLVNRTVLFFLVLCLLSLFLYAIGTVQGFMDDTQLFLLRLGVGLSGLLALSSLYGMILDLYLFFRQKKRRFILAAGLYAFLGIFGGVIAASALFIISAAEGNIQ